MAEKNHPEKEICRGKTEEIGCIHLTDKQARVFRPIALWVLLLIPASLILFLVTAFSHTQDGRNGGDGSASLSSLQLFLHHVPSRGEVCETYLGASLPPGGFSLILTADPGTFSGTPEAHFILSNLRRQRSKPTSATLCAGVTWGELMGQRVLVVTTGIGPTAAALCTEELLSTCGPFLNDMIYFGTSGWSPQLGGVLNPPHCEEANTGRKIVRTGDVCISPVSVNWVCKKSTWSLQAQDYPNQCFRPKEMAGPNATALYGECLFATDNLDANLALADSLIAAARSARGRAALPTRNAEVLERETTYWRLMGEGTGVSYPEVRQADRPVVWDYSQCAEVDGQFFFTGAPWEIKARDYAAEAISEALGFGRPGSDSRDAVGADQVIAVSAMEGVGVAEALEKYHRLDSTPRRIPYTNVRTASNYIHQPVGKVGEGQWDIYAELEEDYVNGYAYAIATGSTTILTLFQQRCLAAQRLRHLAARDPDTRQMVEGGLREDGMGGLALWAREGGAGAGAQGAAGEAAAEGEGGAVGAAGGRRAGARWVDGGAGPGGDVEGSLCQFTVDYK